MMQEPDGEDTEIVELPQNELETRLSSLRVIAEASKKTVAELAKTFPDFAVKLDDLSKLGTSILHFLNGRMLESDSDKDVLLTLATLAKCCFTMNIELYAQSIRPAADAIALLPDVKVLAMREITSPWTNIKNFIYAASQNDARENFRELLLGNVTQDMGKDLIRELDHLERFLVDPDGRPPNEFIPEYVKNHKEELQKWLSLSTGDFETYLSKELDTRSLSAREELLETLDEQLASIKPKHVIETLGQSQQYADRTQKLALVRDLRFNRDDALEMKKRALDREFDVTNKTYLNEFRKKYGKDLQQNMKAVIDALLNSHALEPVSRMELMQATISQLGLPEATASSIIADLSGKIEGKSILVQEEMDKSMTVSGTLYIDDMSIFKMNLKIKDGVVLAVVDEKGDESEASLHNEDLYFVDEVFVDIVENFFQSHNVMFQGNPSTSEDQEEWPGSMHSNAFSLNVAIRNKEITIEFDGDSFWIEDLDNKL